MDAKPVWRDVGYELRCKARQCKADGTGHGIHPSVVGRNLNVVVITDSLTLPGTQSRHSLTTFLLGQIGN